MRKGPILILNILFYLMSRSGSAQEETTAIIKQIQDKAKEIQSYQASFTLKMVGPQGEILMEGNILFKRPEKIKLEMSMPNVPDAKQLMVSDGNLMWQVAPSLKLASKVDLATLKKEFGESYFTPVQEDISRPLKEVEEGSVKYLGKDSLEDKEYFLFEAKPKSQTPGIEAAFSKARFWIDPDTGLEKKTVFYDLEGKEVFQRNFSEVKINLEISDHEFIFLPEEGMEVIDSTDQARKLMEAEKKGESPSFPSELPSPSRP